MAELENYQVRPYQKGDNKHPFSCGVDELDHYFHRTLSQDIKRNQAAGYVLWDNQRSTVAGYFTLSAIHVAFSAIPAEHQKKLSYEQVPFLLLGRLAIDTHYKGQGLGKMLLMAVFQLTVQIKQQLGAWGLAVDPINQAAEDFYARFDFQKLPNDKRLFISLQTIQKLFP